MPDPHPDQPRLRTRVSGRREEERLPLELRAWRAEDAPALLEIVGRSPDLDRQLPRLPRTLAEAEGLIREHLMPAQCLWVWAVCHRDVPVGCVRVEAIPEPEIPTGPRGRGWVSYWMDAEHRRRGIATPAVTAACDWALASTGDGLRRLELGYRENNPASAAVARRAGFLVEGLEREKFVVDGVPVGVLTAARLAGSGDGSSALPDGVQRRITGFHHLELWTADFEGVEPAWRNLLEGLGWRHHSAWSGGRAWTPSENDTGSQGGAELPYLVLEQSSDLQPGNDRCGVGMNHVALLCRDREELDRLRETAPSWGWRELFADRYPHAGGPEQEALYLENAEGVEVELVVAPSR